MAGIGKGTTLLIVLFVAIVLPFTLFSTPLGSVTETPFSIYNEDWNGLSEFRAIVESKFPADSDGDGYVDAVKTIISSINALNRLEENESGILVIMGPAVHYDISEAAALVLFLMRGGTIIIADDFGTGNDLLRGLNTLIRAAGSLIGVGGMGENFTMSVEREGKMRDIAFAGIGFNQSVLIETSDYSLSPTRPILHQNQYAQLLSGTLGRRVDNIIADFSSILSMQVRATDTNETWWIPFPGLLGWLETSTHYAWLETSVKAAEQGQYLWNPGEEWAGGLSLSIDVTLNAGDYGNYTFEDVEYATGFCVATGMQFGPQSKLFLCADPSIFINKYLDPTNPEYSIKDPRVLNTQNRDLAEGLIEWAAQGYGDRPVFFFDEGHLENSPRSPIMYTGESMRFIALMTMFPFAAPFFPIFVLMIARRFMPKRTPASARLLTKIERYYGRSFFAVKMRWYTEYEQYGQALHLLYRRLSRIVHEKTKIAETEPEPMARAIASLILTVDPDELAKRLKQIQTAFKGRGINEEEFLKYFYFLKSITDKLVGQEAT